MKIVVDKEGKDAINQLCDVALKQGGIRNLDPITEILSSTVEKVPFEDHGKKLDLKKEQDPALKEETEGKILKDQKLNEDKDK